MKVSELMHKANRSKGARRPKESYRAWRRESAKIGYRALKKQDRNYNGITHSDAA